VLSLDPHRSPKPSNILVYKLKRLMHISFVHGLSPMIGDSNEADLLIRETAAMAAASNIHLHRRDGGHPGVAGAVCGMRSAMQQAVEANAQPACMYAISHLRFVITPLG